MKKKIVLLVMLLCTLFIGTMCVCQATTTNFEAANEKNQSYVLRLTGSRGRMTAEGSVGTTPKCFTSLVNTYSQSIYAYVKVTELDIRTNTTPVFKAKLQPSLGRNLAVATAGLSRSPGNEDKKYVHYAEICDYQNPANVIEEFAYYIDQVDPYMN